MRGINRIVLFGPMLSPDKVAGMITIYRRREPVISPFSCSPSVFYLRRNLANRANANMGQKLDHGLRRQRDTCLLYTSDAADD